MDGNVAFAWVAVALIVVSVQGGAAEAGEPLIWQGELKGVDGRALAEGEVETCFALLDDNGVVLWSEQHPRIPAGERHLSVVLGDKVPLDLPPGMYWLKVTVGDQAPVPPRRFFRSSSAGCTISDTELTHVGTHAAGASGAEAYLVGDLAAVNDGGASKLFVDQSGQTGWWAPARVGETGQNTCRDEAGAVIACAAMGQDGNLRTGVAWPNPRFEDNGDGTVTDMLTGLIWLKDASCSDLAGTDIYGSGDWATALKAPAALASGTCGLSDDSVAGDWRLPSRFELESLLDLEYSIPALSDTAGTAQWGEGDAFLGVVLGGEHWSSTSFAGGPYNAWYVSFTFANVNIGGRTERKYLWPVRGGP